MVQRWTRRNDHTLLAADGVSIVDRIIIPLHINDCHWVIAMIDVQAKRLMYYNSMKVMTLNIMLFISLVSQLQFADASLSPSQYHPSASGLLC